MSAVADVVLSISTVRVTLAPGASWSTTYELARASGEVPGSAMRRIPMLSVPEVDCAAADALLAGTTIPASSDSAIRRNRTTHLPICLSDRVGDRGAVGARGEVRRHDHGNRRVPGGGANAAAGARHDRGLPSQVRCRYRGGNDVGRVGDGARRIAQVAGRVSRARRRGKRAGNDRDDPGGGAAALVRNGDCPERAGHRGRRGSGQLRSEGYRAGRSRNRQGPRIQGERSGGATRDRSLGRDGNADPEYREGGRDEHELPHLGAPLSGG